MVNNERNNNNHPRQRKKRPRTTRWTASIVWYVWLTLWLIATCRGH